MNENKLILQALNCIIAKKKRQLAKNENLLMTCDNDYIQMYTCKSITNLIEKIKQFETLKLKYDKTNL
jgi:hypothetical protein